MPHAALWVVQPEDANAIIRMNCVSMPHAALWVVQPGILWRWIMKLSRFNAARGFVGGAA